MATALVVAGAGAIAASASAQTVLTACGNLNTGNYVLGSNISASGDCFVLMGDNVAIDFKGHTLTGNGTGSGITDGGLERDWAVFANGTIRSFGTGINLPTSHTATLNKMTVSNNDGDGVHIGGCCNSLTDVRADANGGDGVFAADCCHTVSRSSATGNGGSGFELLGCCTTFNDGKSSDNEGIGITMDECCNNVDGSVVEGNGDVGVSSTGCCSFMRDTKVRNNGDDGVFMNECCNLVSDSIVEKNKGTGIGMLDGDNQVIRCKVNKNGVDGIDLSDDDDNIVNGNTVMNNGDEGVHVLCPSSVVDLKAQKNAGGNLVEDAAECTNLNNKAP
jgi:parallel beta-helix repeat protein